MGRSNFKVIIAGGSVTGLTLANALEQLGIDYVVLEAYRDIAPQVGASIGLFPNGLRIVDQLGAYEAFRQGIDPLDGIKVRMHGEFKEFVPGFDSQMKKRHGYGVIFKDRQALLQVLYDNLKDKSKILLSKKVTAVEMGEKSVTVHTQDGDSYTGDILVGGDGVHSHIRSEMWRIGNSLHPGSFPENLSTIFGIANPTKSLPAGLVTSVWHKDYSYLVIGGPAGRVYWFLFEKLPQKLYGDNTPRYSKEDEKAVIEAHRHDRISDEVTLEDLYKNSISTTLTPLHEWTFDKWYFGRIITLGDAAHKMNPINGQGGNNAIEDVAQLANSLVSRLDSSRGALSSGDIESMFGEIQKIRHDRASQAVSESNSRQAIEAFEGPLSEVVTPILAHFLSRDIKGERQTGMAIPAVRINSLPMPKRSHYIPYEDELPAKPLKKATLPRLLAALVFVTLMFAAVKGLDLGRISALPASFLGAPFIGGWTGLPAVDNVLSVLVKFFSAVVTSPDPAHRLQLAYFLTIMVPALLIWTIEANRRGNNQTMMGWLVSCLRPAVFAIAFQIGGIGKIAPLYYLVTLYTSSNPHYSRTSGRPVPLSISQALLPALALSFILPSVSMMLPHAMPSSWQNAIAAWQFAPILVSPLTSLFAAIYRRREPEQPDPRELTPYENKDLPHLLSTYSIVFFASALAHVCLVAFVYTTPAQSLARVFFDVPSPFGTWNSSTLGAQEAIFTWFKWDMLLYVGALLVWCMYTVYELRRMGYITTVSAKTSALAVFGSSVLLGPGATYVGVWYWRENAIAKLSV
ncbi:FAD binding domain-containing protein [Thozetella sp. PMI_491]|nr:FAD binding domain-containing protein [Thozetella sp. PMI_491]